MNPFDVLRDSLYFFKRNLGQIVRLCLTGPFEKDDSPPGLVDLLLAATDLPDITVLEAHLRETAATVRGHFDRLLGGKHK